jgi:hypothetical protein
MSEKEQWEIDLRSKLNAELPDGSYNIGNSSFPCYTGKQGFIEFEVAIQKEVRKLYID